MNYYYIGKFYFNYTKSINFDNYEKNMIDFFRGYMEVNSEFTKQNNNVILDIFIINDKDNELITNILNKLNINNKSNNCILQKNSITYNYIINIQFYNVLDILAKLYYPNLLENEFDSTYYNYYMYLSNYHQIIFNKMTNELQYLIPKCKYIIEDKQAIIPTKACASDVGYDLSVIKVFKQISKIITMYDTGIILIPTYGYYFEIYARSSLSKTGYILANSVGIIDGNYSGTIKVVLIKIDSSMPDIELPFKGMQIILRKMIHYELNNTPSSGLIETSRGDGGFGSTDK